MQVLVTSLFSGRTLCFQTNVDDNTATSITVGHIKDLYATREGIRAENFKLTRHGKVLSEDDAVFPQDTLRAVSSLPGGKGGFGSMLRAIGAQIEKTTNREACRDLSGRRLRDINEEARLKRWMAQQEERERERSERRKAKLERLKETPQHKFEDKDYHKKREELPQQIADAVSEGLTKGGPSGLKRPAKPAKPLPAKKGLWIDPDLGSLSESSSGDEDTSEGSSASRPSREDSADETRESKDESSTDKDYLNAAPTTTVKEPTLQTAATPLAT
uniref:Putative signal transducer n=1 Tax=Ornithodoros turicata TaxID=34597 RepID=A0A2R5LMV1_9ACAR